MRLLKPDAGEVVDRCTILQLKIEAATRLNRNPNHFVQEKKELVTYLYDNKLQDTSEETRDSFYRMERDLLSVNIRLWRNEDEVRALPEVTNLTTIPNIRRLAVLCKQIAKLNDERATLVKSINALFGTTTEEKIHVQSDRTQSSVGRA